MYNEAEKIKYVEQFSSKDSKNEFVRVFKAAEPFEDKLEKDLAEFHRDEIIEFANTLELTNPLTAKKYLSRIRQYQRDINPNLTDNERPVTKDDIDIVSAIRRHFFKSFSDVIAEVQKVRPLNAGYPEPVILTFAWLGFEAKDIGGIKKEDVNLISGHIKVKDNPFSKEIELDDDMLEILRSFDGITTAYRDTKGSFMVHAENSPYFLKRMLRADSKKQTATPKMFTGRDVTKFINDLQKTAAANQGQIYLTYTDVQRSGQFHKVYQVEQTGIDVCDYKRANILCSITNTSQTHFYDTLAQYKAYKQAFDLT